jgi:hypothetical protein
VLGHKICFSTILHLFLLVDVFLAADAHAQFSSRFSLTVGEEYNDNIFFEKNKEHDFITNITPTFTFLYEPPVTGASAFTLSIAPTGQIFARHSELNNFGRNLSVNSGFTYPYSPRLSFHFADTLQLRGQTRTAGVGGEGFESIRRTPIARRAARSTEPLPESQRVGDFINNGDALSNHFSFEASYLYSPNVTVSGGYTNNYTAFFDQGGSELSNSIGLRGAYKWGPEHNLHAGYSLTILKSREGESNIVHNFDVGDDYFSTTQVRLTPTLTLLASTGISLNTGSEGPRVANNINVTLTKLWQTALLNIGVRKGLTNSFGVSGLSDTTTFFSDFNIRFTERLSAQAGVDFSLFDTDDVNFKTFQAQGGLQYAITHWLCSNLQYTHRRRYGGSGASSSDLQTRGLVYANSVSLNFTVDFDLWPNLGLAKRPGCGVGIPTAPQPSPRL